MVQDLTVKLIPQPLPAARHQDQLATGQGSTGLGGAGLRSIGQGSVGHMAPPFYLLPLAPTCSSQRRNACTIGPASSGVSFGVLAISLS